MKVRNLIILGVSQSFGMTGAPIYILLGGIIGYSLAPTPALATLPISLMVVGTTLSVIPASMLMRKMGRRAGFSAGSLLGAVGALAGASGVALGSFALFSLSALFIGVNNAFIQQYRFAAAESAPAGSSGKAVSLVLLGGIAAGFLGPEIARQTKDWLAWGEYTGSFIALMLIYLALAALLAFFQPVSPLMEDGEGAERSLKAVVRQPVFQTAVLAGAVSYGVMSLIMTATPIHLHHGEQFSLDETAWVIQSHIIAMYLPSLATGFLMSKLGVLRVMGTGVLAMAACAALALFGVDLMHFWWALVLLGIGWNFMFVSGTVLLTSSYFPLERFKAQASNDFLIFSIQALASLSAGTVLYLGSWNLLLLITLPFLVLVLIAAARLAVSGGLSKQAAV
jgi:MFS family permease